MVWNYTYNSQNYKLLFLCNYIFCIYVFYDACIYLDFCFLLLRDTPHHHQPQRLPIH